MDITLNLTKGTQETHKNAKFDAFGSHWITFEPRSGPMKGDKILVNMKAYSVQRPTNKGPRVTDSIESITLGKSTARGDCRTCAVAAMLAALQAEVHRLWELQDDPDGPYTSQADDLAGLLETIERALPRRNGGDA